MRGSRGASVLFPLHFLISGQQLHRFAEWYKDVISDEKTCRQFMRAMDMVYEMHGVD